MKDEIRKLGEEANKIEIRLRRKVFALDNHMNECDCDDSTYYDFCNTLPQNECSRFCLNCGGMILFGRE